MEHIRYGRTKKNIRRAIREKLDDWFEHIDDEKLVKLMKRDVIVTGGAIASMILGEKVNDYDVYFRTKETTKKVAEYYCSKFTQTMKIDSVNGDEIIPVVREEEIENIRGIKEERVLIFIQSAGVLSESTDEYDYYESHPEHNLDDFVSKLDPNETSDDDSGEKYRPVFLSQNAITLSNKIQVVIRFFGEPSEIHESYDFVHAMCYYTYHDDNLYLTTDALMSMTSHTLQYRGSLYPIASIFRMKKFIERGWRIGAGEQLKIMWQISELDLSNFDILKEQLTGVDQAYLHQLIYALKDVESDKITSSYVAAIIDKIF